MLVSYNWIHTVDEMYTTVSRESNTYCLYDRWPMLLLLFRDYKANWKLVALPQWALELGNRSALACYEA